MEARRARAQERAGGPAPAEAVHAEAEEPEVPLPPPAAPPPGAAPEGEAPAPRRRLVGKGPG
eukprot:10779544-Lingulodinium_polyedra.AAC.1